MYLKLSSAVKIVPLSFLTALVFLNIASRAWAADPVTNQPDSESSQDVSTKLGLHLNSLISVPSLIILGAAGVASAHTWEETDEHQSGLRRSLDGSPFDGLMDLGNLYGSGWFVGGVTVGAVVVGKQGDNAGLTRFGMDLGRSFVYSALATSVIKVSVNRTRPSGGHFSFPSGHTTSAFSTVPVVWYHAGWIAGLGAGTVACLTALSRIEENRHYASDVIFGAAVGLVFGRAVVSQRRRLDWLDHLVVTDRSVAVVWSF